MGAQRAVDDGAVRLDRRTILKAGGISSTVGFSGCLGFLGEESEFPERDIDFLTLGSGTLFDLWARVLAENVPAHLDADANIVVRNVPGDGQETSYQLYDGNPDGYTVGGVNIPGNLAAQLLFGTEYDLLDTDWQLRIARYPYVLFVHPDSPFESVEDLADAGDVSFSVVALGASDSLQAVVANERYGIDATYVSGYDSGLDATTALEREDVDARYQVGPMVANRIADGDIKPILIVDDEPAGYAPDVPTLADTGDEDLAHWSLQMFVGLPPGVNADRQAVLREAFWKTGTSSAVEEWAEENVPLGLGLAPADGDECEAILEDIDAQMTEHADLLRAELG